MVKRVVNFIVRDAEVSGRVGLQKGRVCRDR